MHPPRSLAACSLVLVFALVSPGPAAGYEGDAPRAAAGSRARPHPTDSRYKAGQVIVRYRSDVREEHRAEIRSRGGVRRVKEHRLTRSELADIVDGSSVEATVARLRKDPRVASAQPNYRYTAAALPDDALFGQLWGLDNTGQYIGGTRTNAVGVVDVDIDAPEAWDVTMGRPEVVVGVIDTAIDVSHPDLAANIWTNPGEVPGDGVDNDLDGYVDDVHGFNFAAHNGNTWRPGEHFHGTHVAGTIAAVIDNGAGVAGVAPRVRIMQLQFLGPDGSGYTSDAIEALAYARAHGVRVTSNSWGGGAYDPELHDAICAFDGVFVAAAGNAAGDSDGAPQYPAAYDCPNIVSVAAVTNRGALASFSNYGRTTVDVGAPGVDVLSTLPDGQFGFLSGTSMAAPHVSGVVALLLSMQPGLSGPEVRDLLVRTVKPLDALRGRTVSGGMVSAANAIHAVELVTDPPDRAIEVPADQLITATYFADVQPGSAFGLIALKRGDAPVPATTTLSGRVLRIAPAAPLAIDGAYTVTLPADAVRDLGGRALRPYTFGFKTHDTVPPALVVTDPQHGAGGVPGSKTITVTFDEDVKIGPALAGVAVSTGGAAVAVALVADRNVLTIDPVYSLARSSTYTVAVPAGAVTDLVGNPQAAFTFAFTTAVDVTPPAFLGSQPRPYTREVPAATDVVIEYTKAVTLAAGAPGIAVSCNGVPTPLALTTASNLLRMHPVSPMKSPALCLVSVPAGALQDEVGNTNAQTDGLYFWTRDDEAPVLQATSPAHGATGAPATRPITVTFDEDVAPGVAIGAVTLTDDAGNAVPLTWSYLDDGYGFTYAYILAFTPQDVLGSLRRYTLTVPAEAITDVSPQHNAVPPFQVSFTTEQDVVPPRVSATDPLANALQVPVGQAVAVSFTEKVVAGRSFASIALQEGAVAVPASLAISGSVLTITPSAALGTDATYTVTLPAGAVADRAGNPLAAAFAFSFTTVDTRPPGVVRTTPAAGEANVPVGTTVWISLSEDALPGPAFAAISIRDQAGNAVATTSGFYADEIGPVPSYLYVAPSAPLAPATRYTVSLPAGALTDGFGNPTTAYAFSFSTPYAVVASAPAAGALGVPLDTAIALTLLGPGSRGTTFGAIALRAGSVAVAATATLDGAALTVRPSAALAQNTSYTLTVPAGAVVSAGGIPLQAFTLTFRTFDPDVPRVTRTTPASGAIGVAVGSAIELWFSEATTPGPAFASVALIDASGARVPASTDYWCDSEGCIDSILVVTPTAPLARGTAYTVSVPAGAVLDAAGNASLPHTFGFTTQ